MNSTGYARFARRLPHSSRDCPVRLVPNPCDLVHVARHQVQELLRRCHLCHEARTSRTTRGMTQSVRELGSPLPPVDVGGSGGRDRHQPRDSHVYG